MAAERIIGIDFGTSTTVIRVKCYQDGKSLGDSERLDTKEAVFGGSPTVPTAIQKIENHSYYGQDALIPRKKAVLYQNFKVCLESVDPEQRREAQALTEEFFGYLYRVYREQSDGGHLGAADDRERTLVSYPVKWSEETKRFMRETAAKAGFRNVEGMDEARAAISAVTLQSEDYLRKKGYLTDGKPCTILLIDMGAGTTDLVLCRYTPGNQPGTEVLCTWPREGDILFGGRDVEDILRRHILGKLPEANSELIMKRLSEGNFKSWKETVVSPALANDERAEDFAALESIVEILDLEVEDYGLDRGNFEAAAKTYLECFPELVEGCLERSGIRREEVELVILTGGHSQWYFVKELLTGKRPEICGKILPQIAEDPGKIVPVARPQETVALGLVYSPMSVKKDNKVRTVAETGRKKGKEPPDWISYYRKNASHMFRAASSHDYAVEFQMIIPDGRLLHFDCVGPGWLDESYQVHIPDKNCHCFSAHRYSPYIIYNDGTVAVEDLQKRVKDSYNDALWDWREIQTSDGGEYVGADAHFYIGLRKNGTVVAAGKNKYGECNVRHWRDVADIACGARHTVGLMENGSVMATGDNKNGQCDVFHWEDVTSVVCSDRCTVGLRSDGRVLIAGNDRGGCNVDDWTDIEEIQVSRSRLKLFAFNGLSIAGRTKNGEVRTTGTLPGSGGWDVRTWKDIVALSVWANILLGVTADGHVQTACEKPQNLEGWNFIHSWENIAVIKQVDPTCYVGIRTDGSIIYTTGVKVGNGRRCVQREPKEGLFLPDSVE
ncbi:MAG: Hsp70 family protein [Clostridiales bacterium]|nr:Hsp70 family protein [Clostridiales bacterium]